MKYCSKCKRELPYDNFYKDKHTKDGYDHYCKDCRKDYYKTNKDIKLSRDKANRDGKYELIKSLKTPCVKCGEDRHYVIQFHHKIPSTKRIGHNIGNYSINKIKDEIDKCICLCANCHREFHYLYGSQPDNPLQALEEYLKKEMVNV